MEIRFTNSPQETKQMDTEQLRKHFLVRKLFQDDTVQLTYSHYDRMIIGGIKPVNKTLPLPKEEEFKSDFFLERREIGMINVGGPAAIIVDKKEYNLAKLDCIYIGKGTKDVKCRSRSKKDPALLYLLSAPA